MDVWHGVMLGAALLLGSTAVWAWVMLGRARVEGARAAQRAESAEADGARLAGEVAALRAREEALEGAGRELELRRVELEGELDAKAARHEQELRRIQEIMEERSRGLEQRERDFREMAAARDRQAREAFQSLAAQALGASTQEFLKLAEQKLGAVQNAGAAEIEKRRDAVDRLVQPIGEALRKSEEKLASFEKGWAGDRERLGEQIRALGMAGEGLRMETGKLVRALREPKTRGMYGEMQLKRVAELAGMREYCDFDEQAGTRDAQGSLQVPDMIVRLPSGRVLAVDAKANLKPYLDAIEATEPGAVEERLQAFADGIAKQASALASKEYWKQFDGSPEFVVMFVPGDQFVDAALARRPDLLDLAASRRVLLASPSSLIALLRAVHVGFQERRLAEEAHELRDLGRELHERAASAMEHVSRLGGSLEKAVEHYNRFVASYESRLEPTLRKFEETGTKGGKELVEVKSAAVRVKMPGDQAMLPGV